MTAPTERVRDPDPEPTDPLATIRRLERGRGATFNPSNRYRRD